MRQAYNGGFDRAYQVLEKFYGNNIGTYRGFMVNYIFEMTLCFCEKIISGKIEDSPETEYSIWLAVNNSVKSWTGKPEMTKPTAMQ